MVEFKNRNVIIFDWLSFTLKASTVDEIFNILGFEDVRQYFFQTSGAHGYRSRLYYECVSIHYDGGANQGIWVELTGQGCRFFESNSKHENLESLMLLLLCREDVNITRLDVAYDDFKGFLELDRILMDVRNFNWISPAGVKWWEAVYSSAGMSCYLGSPKSDFRLRFYDKAAERKKKGIHWVRCEIQLRDELAYSFAEKLILELQDVGVVFFGVLNNYIRFVDPSSSDSNRRRWKTSQWWNDFLLHCSQISLCSKVGIEYNYTNLENYLKKQCLNSLDAYIEINGIDSLVKLLNSRHSELPPKYQTLIREMKEQNNARKGYRC